jgi:excinuclease ABC subunit A
MPPPLTPASPAIEVRKAETHNLKGVSCRVPHGRVTVVTGPSGAGKSSLAFDTIFAEGQRRFVESMSTYARQFLNQMERPPVELIEGLLPSVALEAKNAIKNARSTVGTITEAHDVLRLLMTHLGEVGCVHGHGPVVRYTAEEAAAALAGGAVGEKFLLLVRLARPKKAAKEALAELIRQGWARRLGEDGQPVRMEQGEDWPKSLDPLPIVLGRFRADPEVGLALPAAVEEGFRLGGGRFEAVGPAATRIFSSELACPVCGTAARRPVPPLFSFNSPLGACPTCEGFGRVIGVDRERVVPEPGKSLAERPIAPWNTPAYEELYEQLYVACKRRGVPLDVPWERLEDDDHAWIWGGKGGFVSLNEFFRWLEGRSYKVHVRVLLARYRAYNPCPSCGGARLNPEALAVRLRGRNLAEITALSIEALRAWLAEQVWSERERAVAGHLLEELGTRVEVLHRVGLDYLTLDRQARTLSGGEAQRIHLAAALGSGLTSTLYVLDEPTLGLHPQDSGRLLVLLKDLAARGNTVLVVEHDRTLMTGADWLIDMGPEAGERGGTVVAEGPLATILAHESSLTARYLRERVPTQAWEHLARFRRERGRESLDEELAHRPQVEIRGARAHNLKNVSVSFPLGSLVAVTGVSGSGKSSLVEDVLYANYQRARGVVDVDPGEVDALLGLACLEDLVLVDQRPLGRSSRSNPVTYVKAYDDIRQLFGESPSAKLHRVTPAHFSFNLDRGRCPVCEGTGVTEVDMQFMAPVTVVCERCQGHRFRPDVLQVTVHGKNIAEVLELSVAEAQTFFVGHKKLLRRLQLLADVGLDYLRLGQPTSTLSGGEAQRLKLASFLDRPASAKPLLFLFDEPTTGLHLADIDLLYRTLRRLVLRGDSVVVVEHSLELIARADWVVDLGPGGGSHGGEILSSSSLAAFLERSESPTARELRGLLRWTRGSRGEA